MEELLTCPHGRNSTPATCSQCIGIKPRRITLDEKRNVLLIDGIVARTIDTPLPQLGVVLPKARRR
jgi:hypothetical protein